MKSPQKSDTQRAAVAHQRLVRRLDQRDRKIAGLERKVARLEKALAWRTLDLESLSNNVRREVQDALCNVRMIPVSGGIKTSRIMEVRDIPANAKGLPPATGDHPSAWELKVDLSREACLRAW